MRPTIRLVFVTALRDRLFVFLYGLLGLTFSVSAFLGSAPIVETAEATVVYMAGAARFILVLGLIVFVAFHVARMFDSREVEAVLSRSVSRHGFIIAYWLGLAVIAILMAAPVVGVIMMFHKSAAGAVWWNISLIFELFIVLGFALFAALTFEKAVPTTLATLGFYALSRLMTFLVGIATMGHQSGANIFLNPYVEALSFILPRLDLFTQTRWLVYGPEAPTVFLIIVLQTIIYVPLLLLAASRDLSQKNF